jgi:hypothetical protein
MSAPRSHGVPTRVAIIVQSFWRSLASYAVTKGVHDHENRNETRTGRRIEGLLTLPDLHAHGRRYSNHSREIDEGKARAEMLALFVFSRPGFHSAVRQSRLSRPETAERGPVLL